MENTKKSPVLKTKNQGINPTRIVQGILLALLAVLAVLVVTELFKYPGPRLEVGDADIDLGKQPQFTEVPVTIKIKNTGSKVLHLNEMKIPCSCTKKKSMPDMLKPYSEATIVLGLNTGGTVGLMERSVTLVSDDPVNPELKVLFKADVFKLYKSDPENFNFGLIFEQTGNQKDIKIKQINGKKFKVTGADYDQKTMDVSWKSLDDATVSVTVRIRPGLTTPSFNGKVTLRFDNGDQFELYPHGTVQAGDIYMDPLYLSFVNVEDPTVAKRLNLKSNSGRPFKILRCENPFPQLNVKWFPALAASDYRIEVSLKPDSEKPSTRPAAITFITDARTEKDRKIVLSILF
ncbi:MAG: DUF1573 domain-containing protein [Spirochaetales bacterium]|nr:DUF1573 domain-containing protein [Spirochaetales bacterium]